MVCLKTVAFDKIGKLTVPYGDGLVQDFHLFPRTRYIVNYGRYFRIKDRPFDPKHICFIMDEA